MSLGGSRPRSRAHRGRDRCGGIANFVTFLERTDATGATCAAPNIGDERDPQMREFASPAFHPLAAPRDCTRPLFVAHGRTRACPTRKPSRIGLRVRTALGVVPAGKQRRPRLREGKRRLLLLRNDPIPRGNRAQIAVPSKQSPSLPGIAPDRAAAAAVAIVGLGRQRRGGASIKASFALRLFGGVRGSRWIPALPSDFAPNMKTRASKSMAPFSRMIAEARSARLSASP